MSLLLKHIASGGGATAVPPVGDLIYSGFAPSVAITPATITEIVRPTPRRYRTAEEIAEEIRQQRIKFGVVPPDEIIKEVAAKKPTRAEVLDIPELRLDEQSLISSLKDDLAIARHKAMARQLELLIIEYKLAIQREDDIAIALLLFAA